MIALKTIYKACIDLKFVSLFMPENCKFKFLIKDHVHIWYRLSEMLRTKPTQYY